MPNQPKSQNMAPPPTKKRSQVVGEQRRILKAWIGGQRVALTPSPSHACISNPGFLNLSFRACCCLS